MAGKSIQPMKACYETSLKYCSSPPSPAAQELERVVSLSSAATGDFSSMNLPFHFLKSCGLLSSHKQGWSAVLYYRRNGRTQSNKNSPEKQRVNLYRPKGMSGVVFKVWKPWNVSFHSGKPVMFPHQLEQFVPVWHKANNKITTFFSVTTSTNHLLMKM